MKIQIESQRVIGPFSENGLALLRDHSTFGLALENHCQRVFEFSRMLLPREFGTEEADLLLAACYLHDIGLCIGDPGAVEGEPSNFLLRGVAFVAPWLEKWGLSAQQKAVVRDALLYNHSLRRVPHQSREGEAVRRAVQVEHSRGLVRQGLVRREIRAVFDRFPRLDFDRVLLSFFRIAALQDDPRGLRRVFFPTGLRSPALFR